MQKDDNCFCFSFLTGIYFASDIRKYLVKKTLMTIKFEP